jgi:hypothetical protein
MRGPDGDAGAGLPAAGPVPIIGQNNVDALLDREGRKIGILCAGCGANLTGPHWLYVVFQPFMDPTHGAALASAMTRVCANNPACNAWHELESQAAARKLVKEGWEILGNTSGTSGEGSSERAGGHTP